MSVRIAQWNPQTLSERRGKRRGAWEDVEGWGCSRHTAHVCGISTMQSTHLINVW
jgi:hypothetical protein